MFIRPLIEEFKKQMFAVVMLSTQIIAYCNTVLSIWLQIVGRVAGYQKLYIYTASTANGLLMLMDVRI